MRTPSLRAPIFLALAALAVTFVAPLTSSAQQRQLTFTDLMKIREIEQPSISADGRWLAFTAEPDRGDPEVIIRSTRDDTPRYTVSPGSNPVISGDSRWVAVRIDPTLEERETLSRNDLPKRAMALVATESGTVEHVEGVQSFAFSEDGAWLAYHRFAAEPEEGAEEPEGDREPGTTLVLKRMSSGEEIEIADVRDFSFDDAGRYLAYTVASADNSRDGLYVRDLRSGEERAVHTQAFGHYSELTWNEDSPDLAFTFATEDEDGEAGWASIMAWDGETATELVTGADAPEGWVIPANNNLSWSDDAERVFFGWRPMHADEMEEETEEAEEEDFDAYSVDGILADRGVDVWHYMDPQIMPQQKVMANRLRNRTYLAVHHLDAGRTIPLGDEDLPQVQVPGNASVTLATTDVPYAVESTWTGGHDDVWVVDLSTGSRELVVRRIDSRPSLSPEGRFVVYYDGGVGHYFLFDVATGTARNITENLGVPIANEDHDFPRPAPGYGVAGWIEDDEAVLIYDKFDIWSIPTDGGSPHSITGEEGRPAQRIFRIVNLDRDADAIAPNADLLLSSYGDWSKDHGFYEARADRSGVQEILETDQVYRVIAKADDADVLLYTREDYDEFPDLWVAEPDFSGARKVTDVNPEIREFAWGTAELTEWLSIDGIPIQGAVIKPNDYDPDKRYPVLVYYYRFFSQRVNEFNQPAINHRPSFPIYASDGYVVFLPDVRFEVGRPGYSATKSVVPGVQHLIDIGVADPDAVALHGHSWSGYQTAFVVTESDIFATAIAGAPVGNMTSAYSGIRHGSGLARQFQYEQQQSRLSGSLWEARDEYIDNSPIFFADRINTPMLILHGDEDDAVPWEQSIELYLALRRLGKETVFLQYNGEPHHPQTYANKLDWAMKMKEWTDHYLKGTPAPAWITDGIPYTGR